MIRSFDTLSGRSFERIPGQPRYAFSLSDSEDFYDMLGWMERGGYQGGVILFYDLQDGKVFQPFEKKRNVLYGRPLWSQDSLYFLQGDFNHGKITLLRWLPGRDPEAVVSLRVKDVDLYNLSLMGDDVHIISQRDALTCYYPEKFSFPLRPNESALFIADGKVYLNAWVEEGWDDVHECATDAYRYYEKLVIKDLTGKTISRTLGSLTQADDGTWWIS